MPDIDFSVLSVTTILLVYLAGLATSLTPCIYPMIPIVVGYLGNQSGSLKRRAFLCLAYVVGLTLVYTLLGIVAALTHNIFGAMTANEYVYIAFGLVLLFLGGSMMDWYQIPMPSFLASRGGASEPSKLGSPITAFLVGASSGLVAVPCAAPVLGSLLLFIATQGKILQGGVFMFVFALGMNTLLLGLGLFVSLAAKLPKSGRWMVVMKQALAIILLITGLYFIYKAGQLS